LETPITNLSAALAPPIGGPAAANKAKAAIPLKRLIVPPTGVIFAAETLQFLISSRHALFAICSYLALWFEIAPDAIIPRLAFE
jgi:hypothetical protein